MKRFALIFAMAALLLCGAAPLSATYAQTPAFNPAPGNYNGFVMVTLSSGTAGATICFTTDGSLPAGDGAGNCLQGSVYASPVLIAAPGTTTLQALATAAGYTDSPAAGGSYTITQHPNWSYILAHWVQDASGNAMTSGSLCVVGAPTSNFTAGGGGVITSQPACAAVSYGAIADGSLRVPDSAFTGPQNITYSITATDHASGKVTLQFSGVYISGAVWSLDTYVPSPGVIPLQYGFRLRGAYNPATQYKQNDVVSCILAQGCATQPGGYMAIVPSQGQTPDVSLAAWQLLAAPGLPGGSDFSVDIDHPLTTDSGRWQHRVDHNFTFQKISCFADSADGAATVSVNLDLRATATPRVPGASVLSSPLLCGANNSETTTFAIPAGQADAPIAVDIVATSGAPTGVNVHVFTK